MTLKRKSTVAIQTLSKGHPFLQLNQHLAKSGRKSLLRVLQQAPMLKMVHEKSACSGLPGLEEVLVLLRKPKNTSVTFKRLHLPFPVFLVQNHSLKLRSETFIFESKTEKIKPQLICILSCVSSLKPLEITKVKCFLRKETGVGLCKAVATLKLRARAPRQDRTTLHLSCLRRKISFITFTFLCKQRDVLKSFASSQLWFRESQPSSGPCLYFGLKTYLFLNCKKDKY